MENSFVTESLSLLLNTLEAARSTTTSIFTDDVVGLHAQPSDHLAAIAVRPVLDVNGDPTLSCHAHLAIAAIPEEALGKLGAIVHFVYTLIAGDEQQPFHFLIRHLRPSNSSRWILLTWLPLRPRSRISTLGSGAVRDLLLQAISGLSIVATVVTSTYSADELENLLSRPLLRESRLALNSEQPAASAFRRCSRGLLDACSPNKSALLINIPDALEETLAKFRAGAIQGIEMRFDDNTSSLVAIRAFRFDSLEELSRKMVATQMEPRFYLVRYLMRTVLILFGAEKRAISASVPAAFIKASVKEGIEKSLQCTVSRSVDMRRDDNVSVAFQSEHIRPHLGGFTALDARGIADSATAAGPPLPTSLLLSDVSARHHPPISQKGLDPFLALAAAPADDGGQTMAYNAVATHARLSF